MSFEPWMLAAMDQAGYNGIRKDHIEAVAQELWQIGSSEITYPIFCTACCRCGVDPEQFTQENLDQLEALLNWRC